MKKSLQVRFQKSTAVLATFFTLAAVGVASAQAQHSSASKAPSMPATPRFSLSTSQIQSMSGQDSTNQGQYFNALQAIDPRNLESFIRYEPSYPVGQSPDTDEGLANYYAPRAMQPKAISAPAGGIFLDLD
ncbi:MAG: hypothetical protein M3Y56_08495, partial [Armatimonadota bacterium]|nr:hypothetical protein [Armatimonadota bacterium]